MALKDRMTGREEDKHQALMAFERHVGSAPTASNAYVSEAFLAWNPSAKPTTSNMPHRVFMG